MAPWPVSTISVIYTAELWQFSLVKGLLGCHVLAIARTSDLFAQYIKNRTKRWKFPNMVQINLCALVKPAVLKRSDYDRRFFLKPAPVSPSAAEDVLEIYFPIDMIG